jgi:hypothetical protein
LIEPRAVWFDLENDGDLDVLMLQRYFPRPVQEAYAGVFPFTAALLRNAGPARHHWLQIELRGPAGNRQAIDARVSVATPERAQLQQVGQAESSHYSQGHYRLYFGLGRHGAADVTVYWPDGRVQETKGLRSDRLLVLTYPDAQVP